ncbi:hypothetical protein MRX96_001076 [Rhipicephalus microplus]
MYPGLPYRHSYRSWSPGSSIVDPRARLRRWRHSGIRDQNLRPPSEGTSLGLTALFGAAAELSSRSESTSLGNSALRRSCWTLFAIGDHLVRLNFALRRSYWTLRAIGEHLVRLNSAL